MFEVFMFLKTIFSGYMFTFSSFSLMCIFVSNVSTLHGCFLDEYIHIEVAS